MVLLLMLILPLLEDEKRPSRPLGKVEWMTSIADSTSKPARHARPPPGKRCFAKSEPVRLFKTHFRRLGSPPYHIYSVLQILASD